MSLDYSLFIRKVNILYNPYLFMKHSRPNILWITLDSVRADHTSLDDYHRDTTPEIDRIASSSEGLCFEHGIAHSTRTPVSVPSMLSGLYPSRHGMIGTDPGMLLDLITTAPELFAEQGYQTMAISQNPYAGEAKGFDDRFDNFSDIKLSGMADLTHFVPTLVKYVFNTYSHGPGLTLSRDAHGEQCSFYINDIVKRKLRSTSRGDDPFFCYVHYNDPHHPYIPPRSYQDEYTDEIQDSTEDALAFAREMHEEMYPWMADGLQLSDAQWEMLHAMYDATIKYTDSCVGKLFDFVTNNFPDTIVVITADHGDLFGEYGLLGHHMVLHDGLIRVPLVTHGLPNVEEHSRNPTQHIDVMQTLLSMVGADTSQFQGYNIQNETRTKAISQDLRGTVDDENSQNYERIIQYNDDIDLSHLPQSMITAVRTTKFKFIHTNEWTKLYELPNETDDVSEKYPDINEELQSFTKQWLQSEGKPLELGTNDAELNRETEQRLKDMGYLE